MVVRALVVATPPFLFVPRVDFNGMTFVFVEKAKRTQQEKVGVFRILDADESAEVRLT